jgi:ATP-dependent helicase IRC3
MDLRDYQQECLSHILAKYKEGKRRQLVCLPTGTGKTVIFAAFPSFFRMKNKMLVLAHREELVDQARDKILSANPGLTVGIEQAGRKADPDSDVVVASVPTLGRGNSRRIERLDPDRFFLVVVDEAHHSTATTYKRVLERFGVMDDDTQKLLVGFTATPKRGDGQGLDAVFQEIVYSKSLPEMILARHLSPVAGYRIETAVDLSRVKTRMGDFVSSQLSEAVNIKERNDLVVKVCKEHLSGRQTLVFCVDVSHAVSLSETFRASGVKAASITGDTPGDERARTLSRFGAGEVNVLTNCMVLTEGYDESAIAGIVLARPTKSSLLYTQMIGRGTRLHPGKENVLVIDIVDVTRDQKLATLPSLFGLSQDYNLEGHTTTQVQEALRWAEENRPWVRVDHATSLSELRYRCKKVNLFDLETPEEIIWASRFAWAGMGHGSYRLGLAGGEAIVVSPTILGFWEVSLRKGGGERVLTTSGDVFEALTAAEEYVEEERKDSVRLVLREVRWRHERASPKQLEIIKRRGIAIPAGLTKGQASHLIGMLPRAATGRRPGAAKQ